jgi:hypothetical protein
VCDKLYQHYQLLGRALTHGRLCTMCRGTGPVPCRRSSSSRLQLSWRPRPSCTW